MFPGMGDVSTAMVEFWEKKLWSLLDPDFPNGRKFSSDRKYTSLTCSGGPGFTSGFSGSFWRSRVYLWLWWKFIITCGLLRGIPLSVCLSSDATLAVLFIFTFGGRPLFFFTCSSSVGMIPVAESIFTSGVLPGWSFCVRVDSLRSLCDGSLKPESCWFVGCCPVSGSEWTSGMSRVSPEFISGSCSWGVRSSGCVSCISVSSSDRKFDRSG